MGKYFVFSKEVFFLKKKKYMYKFQEIWDTSLYRSNFRNKYGRKSVVIGDIILTSKN
jgi:hypothetical protein